MMGTRAVALSLLLSAVSCAASETQALKLEDTAGHTDKPRHNDRRADEAGLGGQGATLLRKPVTKCTEPGPAMECKPSVCMKDTFRGGHRCKICEDIQTVEECEKGVDVGGCVWVGAGQCLLDCRADVMGKMCPMLNRNKIEGWKCAAKDGTGKSMPVSGKYVCAMCRIDAACAHTGGNKCQNMGNCMGAKCGDSMLGEQCSPAKCGAALKCHAKDGVGVCNANDGECMKVDCTKQGFGSFCFATAADVAAGLTGTDEHPIDGKYALCPRGAVCRAQGPDGIMEGICDGLVDTNEGKTTSSGGGGSSPGFPVLQLTNGVCRECLYDKDAANQDKNTMCPPDRKFCDGHNRCVACLTEADCTGAPICARGYCVSDVLDAAPMALHMMSAGGVLLPSLTAVAGAAAAYAASQLW